MKVVQHFLSASMGRGNVQLQEKGTTDEMPDFDEACAELWKIDTAGFRALHANALKAKALKRMSPLQTAIVTYYTDLKEWVNCKEEADAMVFHMYKPRPHFLNDFKRDTVLNLKGVHFEMRGGIQTITLKDAISKEQAPGKPPLLYANTFIFVGAPSTGKSEFIHGVCRECCQRRGKQKYGMSASIDPYGLMTKKRHDQGAWCYCLV